VIARNRQASFGHACHDSGPDRCRAASGEAAIIHSMNPRTLGELKASGYQTVSIKEEMRRNLIRKLKAGEPIFDGILGYDETVLPQVQNAVLSKHDMLFLGLRGQAKTRMLRQLTHLLDDATP